RQAASSDWASCRAISALALSASTKKTRWLGSLAEGHIFSAPLFGKAASSPTSTPSPCLALPSCFTPMTSTTLAKWRARHLTPAPAKRPLSWHFRLPAELLRQRTTVVVAPRRVRYLNRFANSFSAARVL